MSNPNREVFEYRGQYKAEYYNQFFNPNICHVCKSVDRGNLILCDQCCLISYCSEEHKTMHRPYHEKLCAVIIKILQVKPQHDTCRFDNWQQWIQSRKVLMESIQTKLDDNMELYAQQMILWSKSCYICHQQANLQVCRRCFSANYCDEHAYTFRSRHNGGKCDRLMLLLNIDIETISGNTTNISFGFLKFVDDESRFEEMLEFCIDYILKQRKGDIDWFAKDYVRSDYLSGPLTVYSGFQRTGTLDFMEKECFVVHIVAVNSIERNSLPAWEILLHLIPEIRKLLIIMIGSELMSYSGKQSLCQRCTNETKELSYISIPMSYHNVIALPEYQSPSVILGCHAELKKENICEKSIQIMVDRGYTLFLTASSVREAKNNVIKIDEVLGRHMEPDIIHRNYFGGLAPHRDVETGDTYFYNEYLTVFNLTCYLANTDSSSSS